MQVSGVTCFGSQATAGSHVQRRGLLDTDGSDRTCLQLRFAHGPQLINGDDLPVMANQLHIARRGGHCERQCFLRVEVAGEDTCVIHVHTVRQAAEAVTGHQFDIATGDGGLVHRAAGRLGRLQCAGTDGEAQLVVVPLGTIGKLAVGFRTRVEHELESTVAALERCLCCPVGTVQLGKLRTHVFRQAGDVGQYLRIALRNAGRYGGTRPESLYRACIRDECTAHECTMTLQVPVLGIAALHLTLISCHGVQHAAAIELEACADIGDLAVGQCIGIITLRRVQQ